MFKVSTKGDYGLLLMTGLTEHYNEGFISLKKIAKEKNLSLPYLSQIVLPLKNAGLVKSKEGILGGYKLARAPGKITLMDILTVLEGNIAPVKCTKTADSKCQCEKTCSIKGAWQGAAMLLFAYFKGKTLVDITSPKKQHNVHSASQH